MPRSGPNGTYTLPGAQDEAQPNTTIQSSINNQGWADIEQTFNTPQPVAYGGTGATDEPTALTNLGAAAEASVVRHDVAQSLSSGAQAQARENIDAVHRTGGFYADLASVPRLNGYYLVLAGAANGMPTDGYWSVTYQGEPSGNGFFIASQTLVDNGVWWGLNTTGGFQGWQRLRSSSDAGWETIAVANPTASVSTEFLDLSAYRTLRLTCALLPVATAGMGIQVSADNGATWLASSSYTHSGYFMVGGTITPITGGTAAYIEIATNATNQIIDTSQTILTEFNKPVRTNSRMIKSGLNLTDRLVSDWGVEIDGNTAWNALRVTSQHNYSGQIILEGVRG